MAAPTLFGSVSSGSVLNGTLTLTIAHTIATGGTDICMYVGVVVDSNQDRSPTVEWDGTSLTLVGEIFGAGTQHVSIFRLVNPDTGTLDVTINATGGVNDWIGGIVAVFENVHQTTPEDTAVTANHGTGSGKRSVSVPSEYDDLVLDVFGGNGSITLTVGPVQTERHNSNQGGGSGFMMAMSTEPGTSTVEMSWDLSASSNRTGQVSVNINSSDPGDQPHINWPWLFQEN